MEDLDFVIRSKKEIASLRSEIKTLQVELANSKQEVSRLNDKISFLMKSNQDFAIRTDQEEKYYRLYLRLRDIVYDEKIDDWVASQWRLMERTDFEAFVGDLRAVFADEERLG